MSNVVHLTTALQKKLNQVKDSVDIQMACQDPLKFNLLCGLAEFLSKRLEGPRIEAVGFTMAAHIAIDDLWTGSFTEKNDNKVLRAYPMLLTIDKSEYDFLNCSVCCLAKFIFGLPSLTDVPRKIEMQSFPEKYLKMIQKPE